MSRLRENMFELDKIVRFVMRCMVSGNGFIVTIQSLGPAQPDGKYARAPGAEKILLRVIRDINGLRRACCQPFHRDLERSWTRLPGGTPPFVREHHGTEISFKSERCQLASLDGKPAVAH